MKNLVVGVSTKTCLFMEGWLFEELLKNITDYPISCLFEMDGVTFTRDDSGDCVSEETVCDLLAEHFGLEEVTSVHLDNCLQLGVWIVYREGKGNRTFYKAFVTNIVDGISSESVLVKDYARLGNAIRAGEACRLNDKAIVEIREYDVSHNVIISKNTGTCVYRKVGTERAV